MTDQDDLASRLLESVNGRCVRGIADIDVVDTHYDVIQSVKVQEKTPLSQTP